LDESTSSVDPENEEKIYKNILKNFEEKTIISSIHKMNLLKFFDRIIIFDHGVIMEDGTFDELLKRNQKFKNMWENFRL
jgi:ABC-type multidrug transport system fused ATPase/permease subunit